MEEIEKLCPSCVGAKQIMVAKQTKGFEYKTCTLCKGKGTVVSQLAEDYIFSITEDDFETNNDW